MPEVKALKCESCGAPLEAGEGQAMVKCPFCGTVNMIKPEPGEAIVDIEPEGITETAVIVEEIKRVTPPSTARSRSTRGLFLVAILINAIGLALAAIAISIASRTRGPDYSFMYAEASDGKLVAVLYGDSKYHLGRIDPKTGRLIWLRETGKDYSVRKLAIGEGRGYASSDDGSVRCYDLRGGELLWERNPGAVVYQDRNIIPVGDGLCFLGNDDTLRFFDGDGNQILRRFCSLSCLLTARGGKIYLAQDTLVIGINPEYGESFFATNIGFYSRYMLSDESGIYILGNAYRTDKTCVAKVHPRTGSMLWQISYPGTYSYDSLLVTNNALYLLGDSLISLKSATGQKQGKFYQEGWEPLKIMSGDKALYILLGRTRGVTTYRLIALDPGSLATKWNKDLQDTLVVVGDGVFVVDAGSEKPRASKLDGETGKELWAKVLDVSGSVYQMLLVDDNLIIRSFGTLCCLRTSDGEQVWREIKR